MEVGGRRARGARTVGCRPTGGIEEEQRLDGRHGSRVGDDAVRARHRRRYCVSRCADGLRPHDQQPQHEERGVGPNADADARGGTQRRHYRLLRPTRTLCAVTMEWSLRREPCPKCGQGIVAVTHRIRLNGWGRVENDAPVSAVGCRTAGCEWYDPRTESTARAAQAAAPHRFVTDRASSSTTHEFGTRREIRPRARHLFGA